MASSDLFTELFNENLTDSAYKKELNYYFRYLEKHDLLDKVFTLTTNDIDAYFSYAIAHKVKSQNTLGTYLAALKELFKYIRKKNSHYDHLYAHINPDSFRQQLGIQLKEKIRKGIINEPLLEVVLSTMDNYLDKKINDSFIEKGHKVIKVLIACSYAKISLIIPLKMNEILDLNLYGLIKLEEKSLYWNNVCIQFPESLLNQLRSFISYVEQYSRCAYTKDKSYFAYLLKSIDQPKKSQYITYAFTETYSLLSLYPMLERNEGGKKDRFQYPPESYKNTAILLMLENGTNVLYLKKLTGLDLKSLISNFDFESLPVDKVFENIQTGLSNTPYYQYL